LSHQALTAGVVAAGANVLGAAVVTSRARWSSAALSLVVALSAGFMLCVALTDLLPDAIARGGRPAALVALAGYLVVHLTQHSVLGHWHHSSDELDAISPTVSATALVGLLLHTFFDGVAIASGFAVSSGLGVLVFIAILLHKVPEGLAISSLVLAAGEGRARAFGAAALLGVSTVVGVSATGLTPWLAANGLALSAGVTLYVAASNLVPEIQHRPGWRFAGAFVAGNVIYLVARLLAGI
jgi:zinc and cadmium transporter